MYGCIAMQAKVVAIALAVTGCQAQNSGTNEEVPAAAVATADVSLLRPDELAELKLRGEQGDPEAAYRVALHYDADPRTARQQEIWLRRAAAQNHPGALQQLAAFLYVRGDKAGCEEAASFVAMLDKSVTDQAKRAALGVDRMVRSVPQSRDVCIRNSR